MIKFEHTEVLGWEHAIRGMRNPMNSWEKSDSLWGIDSTFCENRTSSQKFIVGKNDLDLMLKLAKSGSEHAKYRRMIVVYCDITAPLYWYKEFDTYKIGTVANSCSTMHTIHKKEFELNDFSYEHLSSSQGGASYSWIDSGGIPKYPLELLTEIIRILNSNRTLYLSSKDKRYWWNMIQLLPTSYNQRRTVMMNYEVLSNVYKQRAGHKLDEWESFRDWIRTLPYSELITTYTTRYGEE